MSIRYLKIPLGYGFFTATLLLGACAAPKGSSVPTASSGPTAEAGVTDGGVEGPKGDTGDTGPAGPAGETGAKGPRGATGARGATGPEGRGAGIVSFGMIQAALRNYDFAFYPANDVSSQASQFNASTTNASNLAYSSFLVPFDGTISDLTIRLALTAVADVNPSFTFTVYQSPLTIGTTTATTGWVATGLLKSTGNLAIANGSSLTGVFQNLDDSASVTAGTILTVVISSTNLNDYEIQPANFAASFKYTPN